MLNNGLNAEFFNIFKNKKTGVGQMIVLLLRLKVSNELMGC